MRKLARAAISFSAAVYAANYLLPSGWLIPMALVCAVGGAALAVLRQKQLWTITVVLVFFALGLGCFSLHARATTEKAARYDGQIHKVTAQVLDYPDVYEDYARIEVRISSYYLPNFKAILYDNDKQLTGAKPGDTVVLKAKLSTADTIFGEKYDNYHSKGIYFKLSSKGDAELHRAFDVFSVPKYVSHWLSRRIDRVFQYDTQFFMKALLIGDKDDFYEDESLYVSISRSGILHIVSVSGMHITFLVGLLHFLLGQGRRSALVCLLLVWLFALVTGAGPTIVRAAFMQSCVLMAPVLRRENDPITSMSAILAVILCANPYAAASISLQLSFGAMAGILLFFGKIYAPLASACGKFSHTKVGRYVIASLSSSLSVMVFTMPLTAIHFDSVQLLAPLTNLLCLQAVSWCFCGGWISCALSVIPLAGEYFAWAVSWLARYIFLAAEYVSSVPFSVMYMETRGAWLWIFISCALFGLFFMKKKTSLPGLLAITAMSAAIATGIMYYNAWFYNKSEYVNVLDVGQGQCISVLTDEATLLVDCGNISNLDDAGSLAAAHLYSRGRDCVDLLLLSHLHEDHAGGVTMLLELMDVSYIVLPEDYDDSDELYSKISRAAEKHGTKIIPIGSDEMLKYSDVAIKLYKSSGGRDENERCLISKLIVGDFEMLVMADATAKMEKNLAERADFSDVDALVVSHHGSAYSSSYELLEKVGGNMAIISTGYNNYGHPAEETLERLEECGYNVYRTDLDSTIEIKIGQDYG